MVNKVTKRIDRNYDVLKFLSKISSPNQSLIISSLKSEVIFAIVECALNIIFNKVPLSNQQLLWMKARERDLSKLISKKSILEQKRSILKQKGYLNKLISPVIKYINKNE